MVQTKGQIVENSNLLFRLHHQRFYRNKDMRQTYTHSNSNNPEMIFRLTPLIILFFLKLFQIVFFILYGYSAISLSNLPIFRWPFLTFLHNALIFLFEVMYLFSDSFILYSNFFRLLFLFPIQTSLLCFPLKQCIKRSLGFQNSSLKTYLYDLLYLILYNLSYRCKFFPILFL